MEIFIPQDEEDTTQRNLGEFRARVTPQDGIQQMHQFYPRFENIHFYKINIINIFSFF
jgi:hypothetical protein